MSPHSPVWTLSAEQVYETLSTSTQGLSEAETALRIKHYGFNELPEPAGRSLLLRFTDQLTHFMALLLWVAGTLAFISGTPELGWAIWAVIWINAGFSFSQEFQAEQALAALNKMLPARAKVYRNGMLSEIPVREMVPGDVMQLEEGDSLSETLRERISADARMVSSQSLYVDVSVLTGESLPVARSAEPVVTEKMRASDASNLVFAGSTVSAGRGLAVVEERPPQQAEELEQNLIFVGLVAMIDPPRPEVADAIAKCHQAGIQVTMVTGDYGLTAEAIAKLIGLVDGKARVVTGEEMGLLSHARLRQILQQKSGLVFARVMPEQKLRLVQAYIAMGHIVAVTGDGVNDAPALRAANIGIAMGMSGTDVAREAADIVLIDDNFATIVSAIEQGRAVYQNIRKFITYILASNMAEFIPFLAMVFLKIPPALVILQILAIDLGTDMLPALALGAEEPEAGILLQPPRKKSKPLLDISLLLRAYCFLGLLEGLAGMTGFLLVWWANGYGITELQTINAAVLAHSANATQMAIYHQATTVTLAAIVACQDGNVFACRSERISIFRLGFFSNRLIWLGIAVEWALILSITYVAPLQKIFATAPLFPVQWLMLLLCPPLILMADELRKQIVYRMRSPTYQLVKKPVWK